MKINVAKQRERKKEKEKEKYWHVSGQTFWEKKVSRDQPEKSCTLRQPIRRVMSDKRGVKRPTREKLHSTAANQKRHVG